MPSRCYSSSSHFFLLSLSLFPPSPPPLLLQCLFLLLIFCFLFFSFHFCFLVSSSAASYLLRESSPPSLFSLSARPANSHQQYIVQHLNGPATDWCWSQTKNNILEYTVTSPLWQCIQPLSLVRSFIAKLYNAWNLSPLRHAVLFNIPSSDFQVHAPVLVLDRI